MLLQTRSSNVLPFKILITVQMGPDPDFPEGIREHPKFWRPTCEQVNARSGFRCTAFSEHKLKSKGKLPNCAPEILTDLPKWRAR